MKEGCSWFTGDCSNYDQYFCNSAGDDGCNHDYSAPARCLFSNGLSGDLSADHCPVRHLTSYGYESDYYSVCYDLRGADSKNGNFGKLFNYGMIYIFFFMCIKYIHIHISI